MGDVSKEMTQRGLSSGNSVFKPDNKTHEGNSYSYPGHTGDAIVKEGCSGECPGLA